MDNFIAWINVEGVGLKHAACRNWANYFLVLFIFIISLASCDGLLVGVSGMSHIPSNVFRLPVRTRFYSYRRLEGFFC